MAPKRKQRNNAASAATRVTRSTTRRATTTATPAADPELPKTKKAKTTTTTKQEVETKSPPSPVVSEPEILDGRKTIIIEHCKQCNSFKTRAIQVKDGLEKGVAGVNVVVNPEKPRRGCFEIREEGGDVFVSLLDMKRPFKPMKDLDMEEVISDIVEKIR
ncbi:hypothetical protein CDL12_21388 [Handroanthus impetiginosus]|uniref:Selenoprotein H n=1 Tax=Handroanthus impetiginosus TaxID=429701 RepID=A0A2G9GLH3_9LAMI|nr:hypothetical protein CDL12_21388 [Handroanthus impetiginosus]